MQGICGLTVYKRKLHFVVSAPEMASSVMELGRAPCTFSFCFALKKACIFRDACCSLKTVIDESNQIHNYVEL